MTDLTTFDDAAGLERVTATLARLPAVDPGAPDRIVAAALRRQQVARQRRVWAATTAALVLAAGAGSAGTVLLRRGHPSAADATVAAATAPVPTSAPRVAPPPTATLAAAGADRDDAPVAVSFALVQPKARRVSLVGDFDDWSPSAIPMVRNAAGRWTVSIDLAPGRHAYAFVVDDSVWTTDPKAEVVRDPDYGRDHSIILVGKP